MSELAGRGLSGARAWRFGQLLDSPISPGQKPESLFSPEQKSQYGELLSSGVPHEAAVKAVTGEWPAVLDGVEVAADL